MKKSIWAVALVTILASQSACSWLFGDEEASTPSQTAKTSEQPTQTQTKEIPNVNSTPTSRPQSTVTDVNTVPSGLSKAQDPKYSEAQPTNTVKPAPRPVTVEPAKPQPQSQPANGSAATEPPAPNAAPAAPSPVAQPLPQPNPSSPPVATPSTSPATSGTAALGQVRPFVPSGELNLAPGSSQSLQPLRGGPFPGETGYLYGAYPRYRPHSTAQALYTSPYTGYRSQALSQSAALYFAENSTRLTSQDIAQLEGVANTALTYGRVLQITGHASANKGAQAKAHNAELSLARAQAVAAQLQQMGVPAGLIQITALGDAIATTRGKTSNLDRRVDVYLAN